MPATLVTGANSFVAAHIIERLVAAGHHVTGTARRAAVKDQILQLHPDWRGMLDVVEVKDLADGERWGEVFQAKQYDHVVHVAAPLLDNPANTDYEEHFWKPSVQGNLAMLQAAQKHAPNLRSVVVTGSINASTTGSVEELSKGPLTNETWLPISREEARQQNNAYISYCSGKKEGELAIWDFVKTAKPSFTVTVFLPALIFGPPIQPVSGGVKGLNYSAGIIYSLMNGSNEKIPATTFSSYIDVRDLAEAHVRALTEPKVANKRLNIGGLGMTYTALVHSLAKVPELAGRLPADSGEDKNVYVAKVEAQEATEVLQMKYHTLDETMADTAHKLLELEKQG